MIGDSSAHEEVDESSAPSFADAVRDLLDRTEDVIRVHHTTAVEATALKELLRAMARKIQLQELEMDRQREAMEVLQQEVRHLRGQADEAVTLRGEVRHVLHTVDAVAAQQRTQAQRIDKLRADVEDAQLDLTKVLYGSASSVPATAGPSPGSSVRLPTGTLHTPREPRAGAGIGAQSPVNYGGGGALAPSMAAFTPPPAPTAPIGAPPPAASQSPAAMGGSSSSSARPMAGLEITDALQGVKVVAVKPGGPAQIAGMDVGDTIVRVGGHVVKTKAEFVKVLDHCVPGQRLDVSLRREGSNNNKTVRIFLAAK